jgi:uncharacterized protein (TIGR02217 family)
MPAFLDIVFPDQISYGSKGGPKFMTNVFTSASGAEQRNSIWSEARCEYNVSHGIQDKSDMDTLVSFFYAVKGKATGFLFKDWSDYQLTNQTIGTGNGTNTSYQITKTYTFDATSHVRKIKKPKTGTVSGVRVNGVIKTLAVDYTVDHTNGVITFTVPPPTGHAVVVDVAEFYVPARFDTDEMPISLDAYLVESWSSIPVVELRS